jgi:hypothetical protein
MKRSLIVFEILLQSHQWKFVGDRNFDLLRSGRNVTMCVTSKNVIRVQIFVEQPELI